MHTHNYFVYILTNKNKTTLYIGITNDIKNRLYYHQNNDNKQAFTKKYNCFYLIYYEMFGNVNDAIAREKQLKGWSRKKKEKLIYGFNKEWLFLNDEI